MKSILDPTFKYTNSVKTDIRKTFKRVRREMEEEKARKQEDSTKIAQLWEKRQVG